MNSILIVVAMITTLSFVFWYDHRKERKVGQSTKQDRQKAFLCFFLSLLTLLIVFYFSVAAYVVILFISAIVYQVIGIGSTEHGWYRQVRDGDFVGFLVSIPVCWYIYEIQT